MLQEPLLVVGAFYILFFTVIIYVRLDFAITKVRQHLCFYKGSLVSVGLTCLYTCLLWQILCIFWFSFSSFLFTNVCYAVCFESVFYVILL